MRFKGKELVLVLLSFFAVYVIWGATYLAVTIAIETMPPFLMAALRFVAAGLLLLTFSLFTERTRPTKQQVKNALFAGVIILAVGTGGVAWALQYVDSGIAALLISASPLITVFMVWAVMHQAPRLSSYVGVALGVVGMGLLVGQDALIGQESSIWGIIVILNSMIAWGYGSVFVKRADLPKSPGQNAALQMLVGGITLLLFSLLIEDVSSFNIFAVSRSSWWAFAFLVVFGSILAFSAFMYLLERISPEKVSTSTYVNPIVALFLGWWFNDEIITQQSLVAASIMLIGVLFINIDMVAWLKKKINPAPVSKLKP